MHMSVMNNSWIFCSVHAAWVLPETGCGSDVSVPMFPDMSTPGRTGPHRWPRYTGRGRVRSADSKVITKLRHKINSLPQEHCLGRASTHATSVHRGRDEMSLRAVFTSNSIRCRQELGHWPDLDCFKLFASAIRSCIWRNGERVTDFRGTRASAFLSSFSTSAGIHFMYLGSGNSLLPPEALSFACTRTCQNIPRITFDYQAAYKNHSATSCIRGHMFLKIGKWLKKIAYYFCSSSFPVKWNLWQPRISFFSEHIFCLAAGMHYQFFYSDFALDTHADVKRNFRPSTIWFSKF